MRFRFNVKNNNNDEYIFRVTAVESYGGYLYWSAREVFDAMVPSSDDDDNNNNPSRKEYLYRKIIRSLPGKPILKNETVNIPPPPPPPPIINNNDDNNNNNSPPPPPQATRKLKRRTRGLGLRNAYMLTRVQVESMIKKLIAFRRRHENVDRILFFRDWFEKLHRGYIHLLVMKLYGRNYSPQSTPPISVPTMTSDFSIQLKKSYNPYLICDLFCYEENETDMEYVNRYSFTLPYIIFSLKYRYWGKLLMREKKSLMTTGTTAFKSSPSE